MFENKLTLVTGASRGIGRAIAVELGKRGATVVGTATSEGGATNITEYLQQAEIKGKGVVLDVKSEESINACLKNIVEEYGAIEILVNNAGIIGAALAWHKYKTID